MQNNIVTRHSQCNCTAVCNNCVHFCIDKEDELIAKKLLIRLIFQINIYADFYDYENWK